MNAKQIALSVVLLAFGALTAEAVYVHGYVGFFEQVLASPAGITVLADLVIALSLIISWMVQDARRRGTSALPYVLLTLALGSVGPLLYLIRREGNAAETEPAEAARLARAR